jgi:hypothetical protein
MTFWADSGAQDPKRQYRWVMNIGDIPAYTLKKASKPSFVVEETEHKFLSHTYYYPGRVTWNTIEITLADPVDPDLSNHVANIIKNSGYNPPSSYDTAKRGTISKTAAVDALGTSIEIQQLSGDGEVIETWTLKNPWIKDVKFGELDYEGDDLIEITLELRYDWAELDTANKGASPDDNKKVWHTEGA